MVLGTFSSMQAFAQVSIKQTNIVEVSYDCQLDVELKYVGRKVQEGSYGSCSEIPFEVHGAYKGRTFVFNRVVSTRTKLAAIADLAKQCSDLTLQFDESGLYSRCVHDQRPVKGSSSEVPFISREGLTLASNQSEVSLENDQEARKVAVARFCKKLATESTRCEAVRTIIND